MKRDLEIAREIQNWLMPATPARSSRRRHRIRISRSQHRCWRLLRRSFSLHRSARASTEPERLLFIVADVVGKKRPGSPADGDPAGKPQDSGRAPISLLELIESLNQYVCAQNISGCRYSTAFVAERSPRWTSYYVNAGHNWPVLRRAGP